MRLFFSRPRSWHGLKEKENCMSNANTLTDLQPESRLAAVASTACPGCARHTAMVHRCLVVEDDATILKLVAAMLAELGHRVDTAENGAAAIAKITARRYDLVLTDLEMPVMNGFLLASRTKRHSRNTKTAIMTGRCHAEVFSMTTTAVVDAWLFKPFGWGELCHMLEDLELHKS
jgi:CheY-like chemotaxis protein